jgi:DNA-binding GntR family transcriptional regulator
MSIKNLRRVNRLDNTPLYLQIADNIIEYIDQNRLKPGDRLPSQNTLMQYYGVSQITVRQAILKLVNEGMLMGRQGKGVFVAEEKVRAHIGKINVIERFSSTRSNLKYEFVEAILLFPPKRILNLLKLPEGSQAMRVRRKIFMNGTLLGMETRNFPIEIIQLFSEEDLHHTDYLMFFNRDEKTRMGRIDYTTRGSVITDFDAELMGIPEDTFVIMQYGTFFNNAEKPLMTGRTTFIAEKVELQYSVTMD